MKRRVLRIAGVLVAVTAVALGLALANLRTIVLYAMTPSTSFAEEPHPAAPHYAEPSSWSALPERIDAADTSPTGIRAADQRSARADAFYIHTTTYVGSRWNAPVDDPGLNEATDRVATGIQASAFNGCCAVWAPRYRQTNPLTFTHPSGDGAMAVALAYDDVRRAFREFVARRAADRPFILAAHSQGAVLAQNLLREEISGSRLRDQLVAAYLIGGTLTVEGLREQTPDIAPCGDSRQVGCAIAWNARGPSYISTGFEIHAEDPRPRLCTNPLSWRIDDRHMPAEANIGTVFLDSDDRTVRSGFADAQCLDGTLLVRAIDDVPRDFPSRLLDRVLGAQNYHPIEYQMFFMNIRRNAEERVAAMPWTASR